VIVRCSAKPFLERGCHSEVKVDSNRESEDELNNQKTCLQIGDLQEGASNAQYKVEIGF
jgi:hypothetical protein